MMAEFGFYNLSQPQSLIEISVLPYRRDDKQRIPFREAEDQISRVSRKIKKIWDTYLKEGLLNYVMISEITGNPEPVTIVEPSGNQIHYYVQSLGHTSDFTGEILDIFRLTKFGEEQDSSKAAFITIATQHFPRPNFGPLVGLVVEDETRMVTKTQFHFAHGRFYAIHQITQPAVLFPDLGEIDSRQFFSVGFTQIDGQDFLKVEAGLVHDDSRSYWYKNFGGNLIRNYGIRIDDGDVQVVEVAENGIIRGSDPFPLAKAISKVADFKPATAR